MKQQKNQTHDTYGKHFSTKQRLWGILAASLLMFFCGNLQAAVRNHQLAPNFKAASIHGKLIDLHRDYHGKVVALEWTNSKCPFVKKYYLHKDMQNLQKKFTKKGVIWIIINSAAPGKQGYMSDYKARSFYRHNDTHATAIILDRNGALGHLYGAKTTPHFFIINTQGKVVYQGAIDNKPSTRMTDNRHAVNYVSKALKEILAGKKVSTPQTKPYGCSVKY